MRKKSTKESERKRIEKIKEEIENLPPDQIEKIEKLINTVGKKVLSIKEAAEMFDLSEDTIRRALKTGSLQGFQLNKKGNWKIPLEEIERFMKGDK